MTDEVVVNEEKKCDCICCKIVKSECFRKFLAMLLASFLGCSLAILLFAPRPPKMPFPGFMRKCPMMERQFPPAPYMHHNGFKGEFKRHHRPPMGEFKYREMHKEFRGEKPLTETPQTDVAE